MSIKIHGVVDALGLVLVVLVNAANIADVTAGRMLLVDLSLTQATVEHIWADQGYQGPKLPAVAASCGLKLEVVKQLTGI